MAEEYLLIDRVIKTFGKNFTALNAVKFGVKKNEFVCLLGPSGCGKTTLLRIIAGLEEPNSGRVVLSGKDITQFPPAKRNFGIVFQSYALFPNISAYENVSFGLKNRKMPVKEINDKVREVLSLVGLEQEKDKYPAQLSGGQQQRIALARALALSPEVLLLDEPLSALDAKVRVKLRHEIRSLQEKLGITTIMVTHDQEEALTMADKIVVMNNACIEQIGTPQDVYFYPQSPFVADFIGAINFINAAPQTCAIQAIRPEYVRIVPSPTEYSFQAVVKHIEFRGSFFRVTLKLVDAKELHQQQMIAADLPAEIMAETKLGKNQIVLVELPADRVISYSQTEALTYNMMNNCKVN